MTPSWRRYVRFWGARVDEDVDDELAFHVEMRVRDYIEHGLSERAARDAAERRFGNRGIVRHRCLTIGHRRQRHMTRAQTIDTLIQDLRYGVRTLVRQKGWTIVALTTMALGIGASTAVFSAVNSIVLNPLPYRDADRVAAVWQTEPKGAIMIAPSPKIVDAWRAQSQALEGIQEFGSRTMTLSGRGDAANVTAGVIQRDFPAFTGISLIAGRTFLPEETIPGGPPVVILGESLWRSRFAGLSTALGQHLFLNDKPYTIVGIAPDRLRLPTVGSDAGVWLPLVKDSSYFGGFLVARVRKGIAFTAAATQLDGIITRNHLDDGGGPLKFTTRFVRAGDLVNFRTSLFLLSGAVALLLIVACANVAHLLLARGAAREREIAIRVALGAGRWRLARQLLTESSLLAFAGCVAGVAIGYAGVGALGALRPDSMKVLSSTHIDARVLLLAVGVSAVAGIVFGLTAALHAVRRMTSDTLRSSTSSGASAPQTHRVRSLLVVTEMALSAMLLVGASLLVRSVIRLQHIDVGFDSHNLYAMTLNLPAQRYPTANERVAFTDRVMDAARHVPGVVDVARSTGTPPNLGGFMMAPIQVDGLSSISQASAIAMNWVSPNYFQALRIHLDGSTFTDASSSDHDVVINRGLATKYFRDRPAIGSRMRFVRQHQQPDADWMRVVGVVDDVPTRGLASDRGEPFVYQITDAKSGSSRSIITVRVATGVNPTSALRAIVASMDPRIVPPPVSTIDADLEASIATQRFTMILLGVFASLAVVLSAVGLYGVISFVVMQRTREIGIRVALGATPANVASAVVTRGLILSVAGLGAGLLAAVWGSKLIKAALYGVTGTDAVSYACTAVILLAVSVVACAIPMRRAMRVDPVIAMRGD